MTSTVVKLWLEQAKSMARHARRRAKDRGLEFDDQVTADWILEVIEKQRYRCAQTNLLFCLGSNSPWQPSLDRKDKAQGYTTQNIQIVCWIYNRAKGVWTDNDLLIMSQALTQQFYPQHALGLPD